MEDNMKLIRNAIRRIIRLVNPDVIFVDGFVSVKIWDANGILKVNRNLGKNIVTSVGKAVFAALSGNVGSIPAFTYLALGTSTQTPVIGDTALIAEITDTGLARVAATVTRTTTTVTNDTLQLVGNWTASGAKTIQEIGMLNNTLASGTSILGARKLTGALTTANADLVQFTYTIQFS